MQIKIIAPEKKKIVIMNRYLQQVLFFSFVFLFVSCHHNNSDQDHPEGVIHFEIKYTKNKTNVPSVFLPKLMVMKFNKRYAKTSIDAFGFGLAYIHDLRKNINITLLQVLEHKFYYIGEKDEYPCGFGELAGMQVTFLPDTLTIEGLPCLKARISFPDNRHEPFDVWYTKSFKVKNPNRTLPYKAIDGVLMQFNVLFDKIEMQFRAKNVKYQKIPSDEFVIPEGYQLISREKMDGYIRELLEK